MRHKNNKGQISFDSMPETILTLVLIAAIAVGGFLAIDALSSTTACPDLYQYNSGSETCELISNTSVTTSRTTAGNATVTITDGLGNVFDQFPTIGTLLGVGLMLFVIVVGFSVARTRGFV